MRPITSFSPGMKFCGEIRAANSGRIGTFDLREEAVSATGNGLDKTGTFGRVVKRLTDFADGFVESVVEIDEGVRGPKFFLKLLASYDIAGVLKQHSQDLEGLLLQPNS